MAAIRILYLTFLLLADRAAAWSLTNYFTTSITSVWTGGTVSSTYTLSIPVSPTGSVSATSSNITTSSASDVLFYLGPATETLIYEITVTNLFLPTNAPVCVPSYSFYVTTGYCSTSSTSSTTASPTITTRYFVPVIISNPSSCTQTSFSYTSSQDVDLSYLPSIVRTQATEPSEALFITTYVVTMSTNLGGQAVTTSVCDVYLNSDAVTGALPAVEASYLSQCVDPSKFRCSTTRLGPSDDVCGPLPITYPPKGKTGGAAGAATGTSTGASSSTTSKSGAMGLAGAIHWGFVASAGTFTLLGLTWI
ncbi:hypothetical protein BKA61DRAFT_600306 [Leptodontidium sp. MPI-SDFR-AT-0119]|nr:hypothetical protein BKA61DRAFT_600306 [Leptodontidium sp. MPI-SDFR-AT-0119]